MKVTIRKGHRILLDKENKVGIELFAPNHPAIISTLSVQGYNEKGTFGKIHKRYFLFMSFRNTKKLKKRMDKLIEKMKPELIANGANPSEVLIKWPSLKEQ